MADVMEIREEDVLMSSPSPVLVPSSFVALS